MHQAENATGENANQSSGLYSTPSCPIIAIVVVSINRPARD